jgi:hypothetical protein
VGRKPSPNPLVTLITFRVDAATTSALDAELARLVSERPGLSIGRGDVVRMLLSEALRVREKRRYRRSSKKPQ